MRCVPSKISPTLQLLNSPVLFALLVCRQFDFRFRHTTSWCLRFHESVKLTSECNFLSTNSLNQDVSKLSCQQTCSRVFQQRLQFGSHDLTALNAARRRVDRQVTRCDKVKQHYLMTPRRETVARYTYIRDRLRLSDNS